MVDLAGRLTNPTWLLRAKWFAGIIDATNGTFEPSEPMVRRLQRRLDDEEVRRLVETYRQGASVQEVCATFGIHRTTVLAALQRAEVPSRAHTAKLKDDRLVQAAQLYGRGLSLVAVGITMGVDASTVRRHLFRAGVPIRPRRGGLGSRIADGSPAKQTKPGQG